MSKISPIRWPVFVLALGIIIACHFGLRGAEDGDKAKPAADSKEKTTDAKAGDKADGPSRRPTTTRI